MMKSIDFEFKQNKTKSKTKIQMKKIASISAPAKAILCGQHAVVYSEDAIAFGVDLKCYANVWVMKEQQTQKESSIQIKIKIGEQTKVANMIIGMMKRVSVLYQKKGQQYLIGQNFVVNDVEIGFEKFCQSIGQQKEQYDKIVLTTLYKIALFLGIFGIGIQSLQEILKSQSFLIETWSEIPIGKGLGSSASFNSVLATSLMIIFSIMKLTHNNIQQHKPIINHISKIFQKVEHGQPSGIDNFVSIYGGMVLFNKSKNPPFKLINNEKILHYLSENLSIAFVDSGVEKNTKLAVSNVREKYNLYLEGNGEYKQMIEKIGTFPDKIITILGSEGLSDEQRKTKLFEILNLNHQHLKSLGLSNKEIQAIVDRYTIQKRSTAKITGAGMGGVVLIVGQKLFLEEMKSQEKLLFFLSKMNTNGLQVEFENQGDYQ